MERTLTVDARFAGPPGVGNGGYVSGRMAALVGGPAEVTLRLPTPLGRPLRVVEGDDGVVRAMDGAAPIAEARPAEPDLELPAPVGLEAAEAAAVWGRERQAERSLYADCFVCGGNRAPGDGLRLALGPVDGALFAGPWRPEPSLAGADGLVDPVFVWSALDCPSAMAVLDGRESALLLGRMTARVRRCPRVGEATVIVSWALERAGRKSGAGSALFDAGGDCLAFARTLWFRPRPGF
jgi:hypothetical protein